jgi:hypothetical protein
MMLVMATISAEANVFLNDNCSYTAFVVDE